LLDYLDDYLMLIPNGSFHHVESLVHRFEIDRRILKVAAHQELPQAVYSPDVVFIWVKLYEVRVGVYLNCNLLILLLLLRA
jgi:hypothetical protein